MKRITVVSHSAGGGGSERVATLLANALAKKGNEVFFYSIHSDKRDYPLDEAVHYSFGDIKMSKNKALNQVKRAWRLKKFIKENHIDVMISFVYLENIFLIGNHSLKKIYTLRNDPSTFCNHGVTKLIRQVMYADADAVVFQTPDARDYFPEDVRRHSVVIPNPIKSNLPLWLENEHKKEIVVACRISPQKNLKMLIDAFAIVCEKRTDYKLTIYGQGDMKATLETYAKTKNLEDLIEFKGYTNQIHDVMKQASIYVSSSDYEGISNSMLEALAIGVPSVCTDCPVGGARMFIESGKNGFLTRVGDPRDMAEKLLLLMQDDDLQKSFSQNAVNIRERLSSEKVFAMWLELI